MRAVTRIGTVLIVAVGVGAFWACSDSAQPLGSGDKVTNDTAGEDSGSASPPPPAEDGGSESGEGGYGYKPALTTCGGCSCDPTKNYCFSGGTLNKHRISYPYGSGGGFGEPDGATGPPPPPCAVLDAGSTADGCIPLPASCAATPTCNCILSYLQPSYACFLVCSPTPGFLEVYCPDGP